MGCQCSGMDTGKFKGRGTPSSIIVSCRLASECSIRVLTALMEYLTALLESIDVQCQYNRKCMEQSYYILQLNNVIYSCASQQ